jgi:hypothetical protein
MAMGIDIGWWGRIRSDIRERKPPSDPKNKPGDFQKPDMASTMTKMGIVLSR